MHSEGQNLVILNNIIEDIEKFLEEEEIIHFSMYK